MIYDHRTYTFHPGLINDFLRLYETQGYEVQVRHLGEPVGWFVCTDIGPLNQLVHIWKYESLADRGERRARLAQDADWQKYVAQLRPMLVSMENKILSQPGFIRGRAAAGA